MRWGHEPGREGGGDAVGLCNENAEYFGPLPYPVTGYPGGASLGLYANGDLVYDGKVFRGGYRLGKTFSECVCV